MILISEWLRNNIGLIVDVIIGIVGFGGVLLSLYYSRKIQVAEFISNYNEVFITNPTFIEIERKLAGCHDCYCELEKNKNRNGIYKESFEKYCDHVFGTSRLKFNNESHLKKYDESGAITPEYQAIINYLVYLESFSTLINQKQVKIKEVDELFGYRFYLAVNNPVIQNTELCHDYLMFYRGITRAYKRWSKYYNSHTMHKLGIYEPMKEYSFSKVIEEIQV